MLTFFVFDFFIVRELFIPVSELFTAVFFLLPGNKVSVYSGPKKSKVITEIKTQNLEYNDIYWV